MIAICLSLTLLFTVTRLLVLTNIQDSLEVIPNRFNVLKPFQLELEANDNGNGVLSFSIECSEEVNRYFEFIEQFKHACSSEQTYANTIELQIALNSFTANITSQADLEQCWMKYTIRANDTGSEIGSVRQNFKMAKIIPINVLASNLTINCSTGQFPTTEVLSIFPEYMLGVSDGDINVYFTDNRTNDLIVANITGNSLLLSPQSKIDCHKESQLILVLKDEKTNLTSSNVTLGLIYQSSKDITDQKLQLAHSMIILGLLILSAILIWCLNFLYKRMRSTSQVTNQVNRLKPYGDSNASLATRDTHVHNSISEWNKQIIENQKGRMAIGENISVISDYEANRFDPDDFGEIDFDHFKQSPVSMKDMSLDFDHDINPHNMFGN